MGRRADAVQRLFQLNERVILRTGALPPSGLYDTAQFPWAEELRSNWTTIRAELDRVRGRGGPFPLTLETFPLKDENHKYVAPGSEPIDGRWSTYALRTPEGIVPTARAECPQTMALLDKVPHLTIAKFSVTGPRTRIGRHRAPNRGSLRYLLALDVPEPPGSCALQIDPDELVVWSNGRDLLFDHGQYHEAWNDSDCDRTLLFLEVIAPLPFPASTLNAVAQHAYRYYPGLQGSRDRADELARARTGAG